MLPYYKGRLDHLILILPIGGGGIIVDKLFWVKMTTVLIWVLIRALYAEAATPLLNHKQLWRSVL